MARPRFSRRPTCREFGTGRGSWSYVGYLSYLLLVAVGRRLERFSIPWRPQVDAPGVAPWEDPVA